MISDKAQTPGPLADAIGRQKWGLIANAILIVICLLIARSMWHEPEDVDIAISRSVLEGPFILIAGLLDLVWLVWAVVKIVRNPAQWQSILPVTITLAAWVAAYSLDRSQWGPPAG